MITTRILLLTALTLGTTALARAESPSAQRVPVRPLSALAMIDSDHNGTLSAAEIAAAPTILVALDTDGDGIISSEERRATPAGGRAIRASVGSRSSTVAFALDANLDGELQAMEIANAASSLKRLDRNGDGEITGDELRPVMVASRN